MLDDVFIFDAVAHGYDFRPESRIGGDYADFIFNGVYGMHLAFSAPGRPELLLTEDEFLRLADASVVGHSIFGESHTDACIYHEVPVFGYFKEGVSPLRVGIEMRERWPGRVYLYGGVSPHQPGALERIDELVEEHGIVGLKLYPHDLVDGKLRGIRMDDEDVLYPVFERARKHGLKSVAMHKAIPMGQVPLEPYFPFELGTTAKAFPDLQFEIVHGGYAFLEETAYLVQLYPNLWINLEATSALLLRAPRKFAEIIGTLMAAGAAERINWGIGGPVVHSRAFEEAFWSFSFPQDLVEGYGIPQLDERAKRDILGRNAARMLDVDPAAILEAVSGDEFSQQTAPAEPWSCLRSPAGVEAPA